MIYREIKPMDSRTARMLKRLVDKIDEKKVLRAREELFTLKKGERKP